MDRASTGSHRSSLCADFLLIKSKAILHRGLLRFSSGGKGPIQSLCEKNLPFLVFSQVPSAKVVSTLPSFRAPGCLSEKSPALRCAFPWPCSRQASLFHHELRSIFKAPLISLSPFPFAPPAAPSSCLRPRLLPHPVFLQLLMLSAVHACQFLLLLVFSLLLSAGILGPLGLLCEPQTELFLGRLPFLAGGRSMSDDLSPAPLSFHDGCPIAGSFVPAVLFVMALLPLIDCLD